MFLSYINVSLSPPYPFSLKSIKKDIFLGEDSKKGYPEQTELLDGVCLSRPESHWEDYCGDAVDSTTQNAGSWCWLPSLSLFSFQTRTFVQSVCLCTIRSRISSVHLNGTQVAVELKSISVITDQRFIDVGPEPWEGAPWSTSYSSVWQSEGPVSWWYLALCVNKNKWETLAFYSKLSSHVPLQKKKFLTVWPGHWFESRRNCALSLWPWAGPWPPSSQCSNGTIVKITAPQGKNLQSADVHEAQRTVPGRSVCSRRVSCHLLLLFLLITLSSPFYIFHEYHPDSTYFLGILLTMLVYHSFFLSQISHFREGI